MNLKVNVIMLRSWSVSDMGSPLPTLFRAKG